MLIFMPAANLEQKLLKNIFALSGSVPLKGKFVSLSRFGKNAAGASL
jgi:hypothetical protein